LIFFNRYDVIAPFLDHFLAEVALAEPGIPGDDLALQGQDTQKLQCGLVLVGLGVDTDLRDDGGDVRGVGAQEMDAGHLIGSAAPQRLAIKVDDVAQVGTTTPYPGGQDGLVARGVDASKDVGERGGAGRRPMGAAERLGQGWAMIAGELGDGRQGLHAGQQSDGGEVEDGQQGMTPASGLAHLRQQSQGFLEGHGVGGRRVHASSGVGTQATPPKLTDHVNASLPEN
jgi:hypothetical protein